MSPDKRASLVKSLEDFGKKVQMVAADVKKIPLDDPLAPEKIAGMVDELRASACTQRDIACAAMRDDDETEVSGSFSIGFGPRPMY